MMSVELNRCQIKTKTLQLCFNMVDDSKYQWKQVIDKKKISILDFGRKMTLLFVRLLVRIPADFKLTGDFVVDSRTDTEILIGKGKGAKD